MTDAIVDAHHHIWRRADQPWLQGPTVPRIFGRYDAIKRDIRRNDPGHIAEVVHETLELFGPSRCIWGSNFPIEKLWTDYGAIVSSIRAALAALPAEDRRAVLHDNAVRLYRLATP